MIAGAFHLGRSTPSSIGTPHTSSAHAARRVAVVDDGQSYVIAEGPHACLTSSARSHVAVYAYRGQARAMAWMPALESLADEASWTDLDALPRTEWAFVRLQRDGDRLTFLSDLIGTYPLYHARLGDVVYWSTSPEVGQSHYQPRSVSDLYVASAMTMGTLREHDAVAEMEAVRPCHRRHVQRGGQTLESLYWRPDSVAIRKVSEDDAVEALRHELEASVKTRLDAGGSSWFELSGGLDSSTLACLAAKQTTARRVAASPHLVTYVDDDMPKDPEAPFVEEAARACDLHHLSLLTAQYPLIADQEDVLPDHRGGAKKDFARTLRPHGPVLLTSGRFGDAVMGNALRCPESLLSIYRHEGASAFADELLHAACDMRSTVWRELKHIVNLTMPARLQAGTATRNTLRKRRSEWRKESVYFSETSRQIAEDLAPRFALPYAQSRGPRETRPMATFVYYAILQRVDSNRDWRGDVHLSYPYLDWPLLRLVLSLPPHLLVRPGEPRRLMRAAIEGIVPDKIPVRTGKSFAAGPALRRLKLYMPAFLEAPVLMLAERGFVDPVPLKAAFEHLLSGGTRSVGAFSTHHPVRKLAAPCRGIFATPTASLREGQSRQALA